MIVHGQGNAHVPTSTLETDGIVSTAQIVVNLQNPQIYMLKQHIKGTLDLKSVLNVKSTNRALIQTNK
jgi:hypothetical protein